MQNLNPFHTQLRSKRANSTSMLRASGVSFCVMSLLSACASSLDTKPVTNGVERPIISRIFSPYRPDIVQGNFVSKDQLESIRVGMTKEQVKQILGTPLLQDYFHRDRWDYAFMYRVGDTQQMDKRKITLTFNASKLETIQADAVPTDQQFVDEIDSIKNHHRKLDNKINPGLPDPNANPNPAPLFPNAANDSGTPK